MMTTHRHQSAAEPRTLDPLEPPQPRRLTVRVGLAVGASLAAGAAIALVLTLGVFDGAPEHVITGMTLLSFAVGWLLLGTLTARFTEQPQRWAFVPAAGLAGVGAALLVFAPGDSSITALGWIWPAALLTLAGWITAQAHRNLRNWSRRAVVYPVAAAMGLAAVGGAAATTLTATPAMPAQGRLVDVGDHRLYLECRGTGSPTVVLSNGFTENTPNWAWITPTVSQTTRVCTYDRAGLGWSDPAAAPQDGDQVADDLHTLLRTAQVPGPYVLAGHSTGGVYNLIFAARHPTDVAGMVLLDSSTPEQFTALPEYPGAYATYRRLSALFPPLARLGVAHLALGNSFSGLPPEARDQQQAFASTARELNGQRDEWSQLPAAFEQAKALRHLGATPLFVVTAGRGQQPGWAAAQDRLATLSSNAVHHTVADATHAALLEDPTFAAYSNAAILDTLTAARTGATLRS
jgi:pimeloyl-ACP methyl ester carboxylesterase